MSPCKFDPLVFALPLCGLRIATSAIPIVQIRVRTKSRGHAVLERAVDHDSGPEMRTQRCVISQWGSWAEETTSLCRDVERSLHPIIGPKPDEARARHAKFRATRHALAMRTRFDSLGEAAIAILSVPARYRGSGRRQSHPPIENTPEALPSKGNLSRSSERGLMSRFRRGTGRFAKPGRVNKGLRREQMPRDRHFRRMSPLNLSDRSWRTPVVVLCGRDLSLRAGVEILAVDQFDPQPTEANLRHLSGGTHAIRHVSRVISWAARQVTYELIRKSTLQIAKKVEARSEEILPTPHLHEPLKR